MSRRARVSTASSSCQAFMWRGRHGDARDGARWARREAAQGDCNPMVVLKPGLARVCFRSIGTRRSLHHLHGGSWRESPSSSMARRSVSPGCLAGGSDNDACHGHAAWNFCTRSANIRCGGALGQTMGARVMFVNVAKSFVETKRLCACQIHWDIEPCSRHDEAS